MASNGTSHGNSQAPFYFKTSIILIGFAVFISILYVGKEIILPLVYALLIAILLNPAVNYLHSKGINRVIAIVVSEIVTLAVLGGIIYFIAWQLSDFTAELPQLTTRFNEFLDMLTAFIASHFHVSADDVKNYLTEWKNQMLDNSGTVFGKTLITVGTFIGVIFLLPVYIFMILFYKTLLLEFMRKVFQRADHEKVADVLIETKMLIQNYLIGLLIEAGIVAVMNAVALYLIGVRYAILLALIGALLNLIPYIGGIVAVALAMVMALITQGPPEAFLTLIAYIIIQFIDNNFLVPKVVASRVQLNALISIVVVLIGNKLWGVPGMFLSIPLTALVKVILDRINGLEPWGFLLGDNVPSPAKQIFNFTSIRKRKMEEKTKAE